MTTSGAPAEVVEALLQQLFADLGDPQDAEVCQYLAAGLLQDEDADADELSDSLAGFSQNFGRLPPAKQLQLVSDLLQRVRSLTQQQAAQLSQQAAAVAVTGDAQAVPPAGKLANVVDEALSRLSSLTVASGSESGGDGCDDGGNPTASQAQQEAVGVLRELCALQGTCDTFLLHVLVGEGGGNVEAAAAWLLECPDLAAAQLAWQQAQQRRQQEREQEAAERLAARKEIVQRFQLQAVPTGDGTAKGRPAALKAWGADHGGGGGSRSRFRDGNVVTSRGEKYIVEKGEEWDGGSRGKVYTKGKRGKGFA